MTKLNDYCFTCGTKNADGLQLDCRLEGETLVTEIVFEEKYVGYPGIVHGGIVCCVLDEVVASHLYQLGYPAMTADLQVRFKHPIPLGERIRFSSRIETLKKRLWILSAQGFLPNGEVAVTSRAKMLPARFDMEGKSFDYTT